METIIIKVTIHKTEPWMIFLWFGNCTGGMMSTFPPNTTWTQQDARAGNFAQLRGCQVLRWPPPRASALVRQRKRPGFIPAFIRTLALIYVFLHLAMPWELKMDAARVSLPWECPCIPRTAGAKAGWEDEVKWRWGGAVCFTKEPEREERGRSLLICGSSSSSGSEYKTAEVAQWC